MFPESSILGMCHLFLLTLGLGTHVGKLYSASTLVLFLSASCSWDGGSRASAQLKLNVPSMIQNVSWTFLKRSLDVPGAFALPYLPYFSSFCYNFCAALYCISPQMSFKMFHDCSQLFPERSSNVS
jgi:hypothetical protein